MPEKKRAMKEDIEADDYSSMRKLQDSMSGRKEKVVQENLYSSDSKRPIKVPAKLIGKKLKISALRMKSVTIALKSPTDVSDCSALREIDGSFCDGQEFSG